MLDTKLTQVIVMYIFIISAMIIIDTVSPSKITAIVHHKALQAEEKAAADARHISLLKKEEQRLKEEIDLTKV